MQVLIKSFIGFFILFSMGCSQGSPSDMMKEMNVDKAMSPATSAPPKPPAMGNASRDDSAENKTAALDRKLIKKGNVVFETKDIRKMYDHIRTVVEKYEGYISSEKENQSHNRVSNSISIRVPYEHFDKVLAEATDGVMRFDSKSITVSDVTEEFLDVAARLKTKKEMEIRFLALLKKANTIEEILEVERHIGDLRSEIESIEGRLNYLQNQSSLSTLNMTFYETTSQPIIQRNRFTEAFLNGWNNLISFLVGLTNIWPFILILIGVFSALLFYERKRKARK